MSYFIPKNYYRFIFLNDSPTAKDIVQKKRGKSLSPIRTGFLRTTSPLKVNPSLKIFDKSKTRKF
jgi:hypothetical protein